MKQSHQKPLNEVKLVLVSCSLHVVRTAITRHEVQQPPNRLQIFVGQWKLLCDAGQSFGRQQPCGWYITISLLFIIRYLARKLIFIMSSLCPENRKSISRLKDNENKFLIILRCRKIGVLYSAKKNTFCETGNILKKMLTHITAEYFNL